MKTYTRSICALHVLLILALFSLSLSTSVAYAANWRTCNGSPVKWRGTLNVERNTCSIPDTGNVNISYWNGINQWDALTNEIDGFKVRPVSDCTATSGDGINEVGLVHPDTIDGAAGLTLGIIGECFTSSNDIDEADMYIANDLAFTNPSPTFMGVEGRATFVHEFGHFFGFQHEETHSVMKAEDAVPLTGGSVTATVWPQDTTGINSVYGLTENLPNLIPSAQRVVNGVTVLNNSGAALSVCRGQTVSAFAFYIGNAGKAASGTYNLQIRLSDGPTSVTQGTVAAGFTHSLGAFAESSALSLPFVVPSTLTVGNTYYVRLDVDHTSTVSEVRELDNVTTSGRRITVTC